MSDSTKVVKNIYQKIVEVRKKIPYIKKDGQGYGHIYAKESTILGIISEEMNNQGLILYQEIMSIQNVPITITAKDKTTKEVTGIKVDLVYAWIDADSKESFSVRQVLQDSSGDVQACGGILTYGMRYFLLKFFNIATDKDDPDAFDRKMDSFKDEESKHNNISEEQFMKIQPYDNDITSSYKTQVLKALKIKSYMELPADKFDAFFDKLKMVYQERSIRCGS